MYMSRESFNVYRYKYYIMRQINSRVNNIIWKIYRGLSRIIEALVLSTRVFVISIIYIHLCIVLYNLLVNMTKLRGSFDIALSNVYCII